MPKKKQAAPTVDELVALAESLNMIDGALDGDVKEAAENAAELMVENANEGGVRGQIEFMIQEGMFDPSRVGELIREYSMNPDT